MLVNVGGLYKILMTSPKSRALGFDFVWTKGFGLGLGLVN